MIGRQRASCRRCSPSRCRRGAVRAAGMSACCSAAPALRFISSAFAGLHVRLRALRFRERVWWSRSALRPARRHACVRAVGGQSAGRARGPRRRAARPPPGDLPSRPGRVLVQSRSSSIRLDRAPVRGAGDRSTASGCSRSSSLFAFKLISYTDTTVIGVTSARRASALYSLPLQLVEYARSIGRRILEVLLPRLTELVARDESGWLREAYVSATRIACFLVRVARRRPYQRSDRTSSPHGSAPSLRRPSPWPCSCSSASARSPRRPSSQAPLPFYQALHRVARPAAVLTDRGGLSISGSASGWRRVGHQRRRARDRRAARSA